MEAQQRALLLAGTAAAGGSEAATGVLSVTSLQFPAVAAAVKGSTLQSLWGTAACGAVAALQSLFPDKGSRANLEPSTQQQLQPEQQQLWPAGTSRTAPCR